MNQKFYFHDVLQEFNLNKNQRRELAEHSHLEIFKMAMKPFEEAEDIDVILLIVAEGIEQHPEVIEYIKQHPKWIIGCHGLHHDRYNKKTREQAFEDLSLAKKKIENVFNRKVTIFLPPKLRYNGATKGVCDELGLEIHSAGFFAIKYIEVTKINDYPRIDIHHWVPEDRRLVDFFFTVKRLMKHEKT